MDYTKVYYIKADLHPVEQFVISFSVWSYMDTEKRRKTNNHRIKTFPLASDFEMNEYWYGNILKDKFHETYKYMEKLTDRYGNWMSRHGLCGYGFFKANSVEIIIKKEDRK